MNKYFFIPQMSPMLWMFMLLLMFLMMMFFFFIMNYMMILYNSKKIFINSLKWKLIW